MYCTLQSDAHPITSLNNKHSKEKIRFHKVLERSVNRAADSEILLDLIFCLRMMFLILKVQQNEMRVSRILYRLS